MFDWLKKSVTAAFGLFKGVPQEMVAREAAEMLRTWVTGKVTIGSQPPVDIRGQLIADMDKIEASGVPLTHLRGWYREALDGKFPFHENTMITLMAKIPQDDRPKVFARWNTLTRASFIERLNGLHHNALSQTVGAVVEGAMPYVKQGWMLAKGKGQELDKWVGERAQAIRAQQETPTSGHPILRILGLGVGVPIVLFVLLFAFLFDWRLGVGVILLLVGGIVIWKRR